MIRYIAKARITEVRPTPMVMPVLARDVERGGREHAAEQEAGERRAHRELRHVAADRRS